MGSEKLDIDPNLFKDVCDKVSHKIDCTSKKKLFDNQNQLCFDNANIKVDPFFGKLSNNNQIEYNSSSYGNIGKSMMVFDSAIGQNFFKAENNFFNQTNKPISN